MPRNVLMLALPLLGVSVSCSAARQDPPAAAPRARADGLLSPGDALRITVWRHPEFSGDFTVTGDSVLLHPLYQSVKVGGVSLAAARQRLRGLLATYEQDVQLTLEPLFPVAVGGEVRLPNLYRLPTGTTIAQAVAIAGGPTDRARLDRVTLVRRNGRTMLDLLGETAQAERIASGDQVIVARRSEFSVVRDLLLPLTSLTGAVAAVISVSRQ